MATEATELNASNLKQELWKTLKDLRSGAIQPGHGDAIASQAREILRTVYPLRSSPSPRSNAASVCDKSRTPLVAHAAMHKNATPIAIRIHST
jgi:hypothetical protein